MQQKRETEKTEKFSLASGCLHSQREKQEEKEGIMQCLAACYIVQWGGWNRENKGQKDSKIYSLNTFQFYQELNLGSLY